MPDFTIIDKVDVNVKRIVKFGGDSTLVLYDGKGQPLVTIEEFWFIEKKFDKAANSNFYEIRVVEPDEDTTYDSVMAAVKYFRYTVDEAFSKKYTHDGIEAPDLGDNRTWVIKTNREKFRNSYFKAG